MRVTTVCRLLCFAVLVIAGSRASRAGSLTYTHSSSSLPGAPDPAITLQSITGTNDGNNFTFTLKFFNSTVEGPSSGQSDSVTGFINLDTDNKSTTGVSGSLLDSQGFENGFGHFSPASAGIDAYINLSSEADGSHGVPGLVDFVVTSSFQPVATLPVTYANNTLTITIPLSLFSSNNLTLDDTGNFSVIVGNINNSPTDFLPGVASVPEPSAVLLLLLGIPVPLAITTWRLRRRSCAHTR
jgi:hypothetical protein